MIYLKFLDFGSGNFSHGNQNTPLNQNNFGNVNNFDNNRNQFGNRNIPSTLPPTTTPSFTQNRNPPFNQNNNNQWPNNNNNNLNGQG